jgi:hypothetical protein
VRLIGRFRQLGRSSGQAQDNSWVSRKYELDLEEMVTNFAPGHWESRATWAEGQVSYPYVLPIELAGL